MGRNKDGTCNWYKDGIGVLAEFKRLQGQQIGDLFNQGNFRTKVAKHVPAAGTHFHPVSPNLTATTRKGPDNVEKQAVIHETGSDRKPMVGGYCSGVCLDWIRRVLLSGPDRDKSFLWYGLQRVDGVPKRDLETNQERAFQTVGRMGDAWVQSRVRMWAPARPEQVPSGLEGASFVSPAFWKNKTAATLDANFDDDRIAHGREPTTRKHFSQLKLLASLTAVYPNAGRDWLDQVMATGLLPCAASTLSCAVEGQSGHAVAIWQRHTDTARNDAFYLFDPNIGVFSFNREGLENALMVLFWKADWHIPLYDEYASATNARVGYMIFGPPPPPSRELVAEMQAIAATPPPSRAGPGAGRPQRQNPVRTNASGTPAPAQATEATVPRITLSPPDMPSAQATVASIAASAPKNMARATQVLAALSARAMANPYQPQNQGLTTRGLPVKPKAATTPKPVNLEPVKLLKGHLENRLGDKKYHKAFIGKENTQGGYVLLAPQMAAGIPIALSNEPPTMLLPDPTSSTGEMAIAKRDLLKVINRLEKKILKG
jgi:hypothetical protein